MIKNKIIMAYNNHLGDTLKQHLNKMSLTRLGFLYFFVFAGLMKHRQFILVLLFLIIVESIIYYIFYIKLNRERNPRYFLYLNYISLSPSVLFVSSMFLLSYTPQSWFYFVLFTAIYAFVELKAWLIYRKMNWKKVIKLANKRKVFKVDDNNPNLFEYRVVAMNADEQGYKKTWLDKFMDLWIVALIFVVAPIAQLTTFTTPYRDYDIATFVLAIMLIIFCILLNKLILAFHINLKLIRMKERGEF